MTENPQMPRPEAGEKSKLQIASGAAVFAMNAEPGIPHPPPGTYDTYRRMMADPAFVIAQIVAEAPIKSAQWSFEATDDAPADAADMIQKNLETMRPQILNEALRAVNMGWYGAEKIFELKDGWFGLKKLKSLLHELTKIRITPGGAFAGFEQERDKIVLPVEKCWLYTYDQEAGNLYGRARLENARQSGVWSAWVDAHEGAARYDKKMAGSNWVLHYPPDEKVISKDGTEKRAWEVAQDVLNALAASKPIALPNEFAGTLDDIRNMTGAERRRWILEIMEDKTARQPMFITRLEYLDKCKLRSYMVPERSAIEAVTAGSRADSGTASDIVLTMAELLHQDIARVINWHIVDQLLVLNYGEKARGTVYITPQPIQDKTRTLITEIVKTVLTQPASVDLLMGLLDFDAMIDQAGLPKNANIDARTANGSGNVASDTTPPQPQDMPASKALLSLIASIGNR